MHLLALLLALAAQRPDSLAAQVREYVAVDTSVLALTHVLVVDGTGGAPQADLDDATGRMGRHCNARQDAAFPHILPAALHGLRSDHQRGARDQLSRW